MLLLFCQRLQYRGQECNTANIVLFKTNQIVVILYLSDNLLYRCKCSFTVSFLRRKHVATKNTLSVLENYKSLLSSKKNFFDN